MKALWLLVLLASPAAAREVKVTLLEGATGRATHFAFDTRTGDWRKLGGVIGVELRQIRTYRVSGRRLFAAGKALAQADEILYQARVDGTDLVVVRAEESSPWGILAGCAGHPVKVSAVSVLAVEGGSVARRRELARAEGSYRWTAAVLE